MKLLIYHVDVNLLITASSFNVGTQLNMVRNVMRERVKEKPSLVEKPPPTVTPTPAVPTVEVEV